MRGSLGEKINQGGTADIHAWAPGQVVKLFKEGFPPQLGQQEARMTQAVFAAGVVTNTMRTGKQFALVGPQRIRSYTAASCSRETGLSNHLF